MKNKYYIIINLLLPLLVVSCGDNPTETIDSYTGITETDTNGNFIGNIDTEDWCEFEFDFESMNSNYGLNPIYPNPVNAQQWGPFGNSYQICYQYSTPYDDSWTNFNQVDINIINFEGDTIYSLIDSYANGQVGMCAYITDSLVVSSVYRMNMKSGEFECYGDIQFVQ